MLAKELSVSSKAIIEKCRAEDIEVKNHMHVLTAGLAATVREWFSEGAHTTTIEETARVDLTTVRIKPKRKRKSQAAGEADTAETGVAVLEEPAATQAPSLVVLPAAEHAPAGTEAAETTAAPDQPVVDSPIHTAPPPGQDIDERAVAAAPEAPEAPAGEPSVAAEAGPPAAGSPGEAVAEPAPDAPTEPGPSQVQPPPKPGPQNVPQPAKLQGPRVVRMDRPDDIAPPRRAPRPARPPLRTGAPRVEPPGENERRDVRRVHGRPPDRTDGTTGAGRRSPRRSPHDGRVVSSEQLREWRDRDLIERRERLDHATGRGIGGLRAIEGKQARRAGSRQAVERIKKDKIELMEPISVQDFSKAAGITVVDIVRKLMRDHGQMAGKISLIDADTAQLLAADYEIELIVLQRRTGLDRLVDEFAAIERKHVEPRPPVVTVLGHVDHGKTSLLDRIRKADVVAGEAGGITQHIGAYRVRIKDAWVTFLDTPGHQAFTAMRARGANMTDVVVLVVAADDGVMPTTVEAINHAKAANATIVVALNKIDLPHDINKIYPQLAEQGLTPSGEWGGETDVIKTSATTGEGVEDLLSHLATLSEVMDLRADATIPATGTVIEAERRAGVGNVVRILVQEGTLKPGQFVVCGAAHGRARSLRDDHGKAVNKATPSTPVEVSGLTGGAEAGDLFFVVKTAQIAKEIAEEVAAMRREASLRKLSKPTSLESMLADATEGEIPELQVIVKADVQGSVDVLKKVLTDFPRDRVKLNILHDGVGAITQSDVVLAQASEAIIIGFHVIAEPSVRKMAEASGVSIRTYRVIYNVLDDIRKALEEQLPPEEKIETRGRAEVREIFSISRVGKIAGCLVRDGSIARSHMVRVIRDGVVVKDRGQVQSLRRFKDDTREVKAGLECGIRVERFDDLKPGDIIEAFEISQIAQTLD